MIDIIVPVYNTPIQDIERCIESILNQKYKKFTLYIIDDGSNEEIREYLDKISNEQIIVKHISNSGVSNARNYGLEISNGEYITFIDSDDTIESNFLEEALQLLKENDLDLVIGGYKEIVNNEVKKIRTANTDIIIYDKINIVTFMDKLISSKNTQENIEIGNAPVGRIYGRIFKRKNLKNVKFNSEVKISEDTLFMIELSYHLNKIVIVNTTWYNYYINSYSVSHNVTKEKIMPFINMIIAKIEAEKNEVLKKSYKYRLLKTINNHYDILDKEYIEIIFTKYIENTTFNYLEEKIN